MAYMTGPYRDANVLQKMAMLKANDCETKGFDLAALIRGWIELERLKREMRGIPALSAASLRELVAAKREAARNITNDHGSDSPFTEPTNHDTPTAEPTKESLN